MPLTGRPVADHADDGSGAGSGQPYGGLLTFLSDYGLDDSYVGVCHCVIARIAPRVRVLDVCHLIAPQDVEQGSITLAAAVPYLPVAVHLALVDPMAATPVRPIAVRTADGATYLAPDNGLTSRAWEVSGGVLTAYEITNQGWLLPNPSPAFRGRDTFSPVAARLATGAEVADVGPEIDPAGLHRLHLPEPVVDDDHVHAEVCAVDHFGNLALNLARSDLEAAGIVLGDTVELRVDGRRLLVPFLHGYGEVAPGRVAVCEDSFRRVTIAVNLGRASDTLRVRRGSAVVIARALRPPASPARVIGVLDPPAG